MPTVPQLEPRPEFADILRQDETFATGASDDVGERINGWFDRLVLQAGVPFPPSMLLMLCVFCGTTLAGVVFVVQESLLTAAVGAGIGFPLPVVWAAIARGRRQWKIVGQMAGMVDELARAARTGRSLEQCLQLIAEDTPKPLGDEIRLCARKLQMGVPLPEALKALPERTGVISMNVFVMALVVHQETGGDLVRVLERLANTIRDRISFAGRVRAATVASRATAVLMLVLPPLVLAFFIIRDPNYFTSLMDSSWGRIATGTAIMLEVVGSVWVLRILKDTQRG